jgi:hypothetical protein
MRGSIVRGLSEREAARRDFGGTFGMGMDAVLSSYGRRQFPRGRTLPFTDRVSCGPMATFLSLLTYLDRTVLPASVAAGIAFWALRSQIANTAARRCAPASTSMSEINPSRTGFLTKGPTEEHMEPTVTENSALYLAHLKTSKERVAVFRRFRAAAIKYWPTRQQLTFGAFEADSLARRDNGR